MEYTIQKLARMAGVSTRTLRYYDEIGLLHPARVNSSGYRIYGEREVNLLQEILLYRAMEIPLENISSLLHGRKEGRAEALENHLANLMEKQNQLNILITTIQKTLADEKGEYIMADTEKFEGLKKSSLEENEQKYGAEIREKYGEDTVKASNKKWMNMSEAEFNEMNRTNEEMFAKIKVALENNIPPQSAEGIEVATLHKQWLGYTWSFYSEEAHAGLVQMYIDDERFTAYYDERVKGSALFLRDAVLYMLKQA